MSTRSPAGAEKPERPAAGGADPGTADEAPATGRGLAHRASDEGSGQGAVSPHMDGIAAALKLQAEILMRLHEQQQKMGDTIVDTRRSEMMISSTQALNESFTGMRRVQERLLDRLDLSRPKTQLFAALIGLGLLAVAGVIWWGVGRVGEQVERTGEAVRTSNESLATASLDALESRLKSLESRDTEFFKEELERLRGLLGSMADEKTRLTGERDRAREELGAARDRAQRLEAEAANQRTRAEISEKEQARLTEKALVDQRLLLELNKTLEILRGAAGRTAAAPPSADPLGTPAPPAATSDPAPTAVPATSGRMPVTPAVIEALNNLLAKHRGSEVYVATGIREMDSSAVYGITLEVRGQDRSLAKTVEAERCEFVLSSRGALLDLNFESGFVIFQQGLSRTVKSPFFQNRYQILVLGVEPQTWLQARFPFLRVK